MTDAEQQKLLHKLRMAQESEIGDWFLCGEAADEIERLAALVQSNAEPVAWQKVREVLDAARLCLKSRDQSPHEARVREAIESILYTAPPRPDASAGLIEAAEWHENLAKEKLEQAKQAPEDKKRRFLDISFFHDECASARRARAADRRGK